MITSRVMPAAEEEGVEVERAKEEGGTVEAAGSFVSTCGCFGRSWVSLRWIEPTLMVPIVMKKG